MRGAKRTPLIAGNWKMFKTAAQAVDFCSALRAVALPPDVEVVICPAFTALGAADAALRGSPIELGAQNMHAGSEGPYTGEISAPMLREYNVKYVLLGHSERRRDAAESDEAIAWKIPAALAAAITPIVIVGETLDQHRANATTAVVMQQLRTAFVGISEADAARCVIAYEPIWAIGSGLTDEPEQSDAVVGQLRTAVPGLQDVRMLYGGSMKPANAAALMAQPNIDGGLVGGASLSVESLTSIIQAAALKHEQAGAAPKSRS